MLQYVGPALFRYNLPTSESLNDLPHVVVLVHGLAKTSFTKSGRRVANDQPLKIVPHLLAFSAYVRAKYDRTQHDPDFVRRES